MIHKKLENTEKPRYVNEKERTIIHYISTKTPDRYGDVVYPEGIDEAGYRKNPVVLFAHNSNGMAIGRNVWLRVDEKGVLAKTQFADTQLGRDIFRLNADGYLNAWSIGFIVPEGGSEFKNGINHIKNWQLLEYSSVAVPANPDCLNLMLKSVKDNDFKNYLEKTYFKNLNNLEEKQIMDKTKNTPDEIQVKDIPSEPAMGIRLIEPENKFNESRNFFRAIAYKNPDLLPAKFKAVYLNETNASDGGVTVPVEMYKQIMDLVFTQSVIRQYATLLNTKHKEVYIPKLTGVPSFAFVNEGGVKGVSNPGFSRVILTRHDGGFIILLSKQLLEDSAFDLQSYLSGLAAKVISNTIDEAGIKGKSPVVGIMDTSSGCTAIPVGDSPLNITYDHILDAIAAVPSETLPNARFVMHRSVWAHIKKLKYAAGGEFVVTPEDRKAMMLEGFPVVLSDQSYGMSDTADVHGFVAFGDLKHLMLNLRKDLTVSISDSASVSLDGSQLNLWQQGLIGLNFGISFDIKAVFPEALAIISTSN